MLNVKHVPKYPGMPDRHYHAGMHQVCKLCMHSQYSGNEAKNYYIKAKLSQAELNRAKPSQAKMSQAVSKS